MRFAIAVLLATAAQAAVSIPVTVQEALYTGGSTGVARTNDPVTVGIPLPDSAGITTVNSLGLTGPASGQFRSAAVWPSGNIKWVTITTLASLSAGGTTSFTLTDTGSGNFGGSNLATNNVKCDATSNTDYICIDTGTAKFQIKRSNFRVLDLVDIGATHVVLAGASPGLVLNGPNPASYPGNVTCSPTSGGTACTTVYSSANDASSTSIIEENGPVMAVIRSDGSLIDGAAHTYMKYTVRQYFYKNKSYVKATVILRNADYGTTNTFATATKGHQGFELRLTPNITGTLSYSIANHTGTPSTGSLNGTVTADSCGGGGAGQCAYLYQAESTTMKATSWCTASASCVTPSPLNGYAVVANGSSVTSGSASQSPQGWADISDASGVGVEIGQYQLAPYGNHSLEFRSGGTDVRVGIWAAQNNTTSLTTLTPNKPYYMQWPQHSVNDVYMMFHATAPSSLPNDFLKLQHYLVGRAGIADYNAANVFDFPLLDPTEETTYYNAMFAAASPAVTSSSPSDNSASVTPDTLCSNAAMCVFRYYPWPAGSGGNQMDYRLSRLLNFLRRGYTGQYLSAMHFLKYEAELVFPMSDGFSWLSHGSETNTMGIPDAVSANAALATNGTVEVAQEHAHVSALIEAAELSGDQTLVDAIQDGFADMYESSTGSSYNLAYGYSGTNGAILYNERAVGNYMWNTSRLATYLASLGDSAGAILATANADNVYTTEISPAACMQQYMDGVGGQPCNTTWDQFYSQVPASTGQKGISRERGASFMWGQGVDVNSSCGVGTVVRGAGAFQNSIFLQGLWRYRILKGSGSGIYNQIGDLAYGKAQWHLSEMLVDDGTAVWTNNGMRYYEMTDIPNNCNLTVDGSGDGGSYAIWGTTSGGSETQWFPFWVTQAYNGSTTWQRNFNQVLQHMAGVGATDEYWHYTIAAVIYGILHPPNSGATLNNVTITNLVNNGGGSYTISWTVPTGAQSYRVKWDTKTIVELMGFNAGTNAFTGNPATQRNWFAATDATGIPSPAGAGSTQSMTIATGQTGLVSSNFTIKALVGAGGGGGSATAGTAGRTTVKGRTTIH